MFAVESAKARCLKDELAKCKSDYVNLEVVATEALHVGTLSAMEAEYVSQMSSLEDELRSVVMTGCAACQVAYAQLTRSASSSKVAS